MELNLNVCPDNSCKLVITDVSEYSEEESTNYKNLRYSDTISIISIQTNTTEETKLQETFFAEHKNSNDRSITIPIDFDGWFEIHYVVIPTRQWFANEQAKGVNSRFRYYDSIYYSDGEKIYKYSNGQNTTVNISEIDTDGNTNVSYCLNNHFSICNLKKCYINLCKQIFDSGAFQKCSSKNKLDCDLTFRRDMVLMAIHVIEYLVEFSQFAEAQRLLERISSCNGLCANIPNTKLKHGCGCGKKLFV